MRNKAYVNERDRMDQANDTRFLNLYPENREKILLPTANNFCPYLMPLRCLWCFSLTKRAALDSFVADWILTQRNNSI